MPLMPSSAPWANIIVSTVCIVSLLQWIAYTLYGLIDCGLEHSHVTTPHTLPPITFLLLSSPLSSPPLTLLPSLVPSHPSVLPPLPSPLLLQAKEILCNAVDDYYRAKILLPDQVIQEKAADIIRDGDVILVHAL